MSHGPCGRGPARGGPPVAAPCHTGFQRQRGHALIPPRTTLRPSEHPPPDPAALPSKASAAWDRGPLGSANHRAVSSGHGPTATVDAEVVPRPPSVKGNRRTSGDHEHVPCDLRTNCCYISMTTRPGRHCGHTAAETRPGDPPRTRTRHVQSCDWAQAPRPCSWHPGVCPLAVPLSVGRWPRPGRAGGLAEPERAGGTGAEWDEGEGRSGARRSLHGDSHSSGSGGHGRLVFKQVSFKS